MAFEEQLPQWENEGTQPPQSKRVEGWLPNEKPPASWFNWLFGRAYKVMQELQQKAVEREEFDSHASRHASDGPDPITPAMIGAAPISHGSEHNHDGSDPIPDLVQLRDDYDVLWSSGNIEIGTNENGTYIRYPNGIQICYRIFVKNVEDTTTEHALMPAVFADDEPWPACGFGIASANILDDTGGTPGAERRAMLDSIIVSAFGGGSPGGYPGNRWQIRNNRTATQSVAVSLFAMGRWM